MAVEFTTDNFYVTFADAKLAGEEFNQFGIGFAIDGRCLNAHFDGVAVEAGKF